MESMRVDLNESKTWSAKVHGTGLEIRVLAGTVWVTQESDREDHILGRGEVFVAHRHGRVAMQSLTPARVEVAPLAPEHLGPTAKAA
jgi:Protein of unknown function (DUF2917)